MNNTRSLTVFGTFAIAALLGTGGAHALNLLTNGSFEDTTNFVNQGNDTMDLVVGSTLMPGWTVSGSHYVSWIGPTNPFHGLTASDGSYFLDLTGYIFGAPFSGVSQTIPTQAGATYLLTFDLGSDPFWGLQDGVSVSAGSVAGSVFTSTNSGTQNNLWQAESLSFAATGSSTTITLIGNSGDNYIGLDNLSAVQTSSSVPEPSTWVMMLVGLGGLGFAAYRSKQAGRIDFRGLIGLC
jgi:Protein of unknown function (DUF642)/PEP-CTERM motif